MKVMVGPRLEQVVRRELNSVAWHVESNYRIDSKSYRDAVRCLKNVLTPILVWRHCLGRAKEETGRGCVSSTGHRSRSNNSQRSFGSAWRCWSRRDRTRRESSQEHGAPNHHEPGKPTNHRPGSSDWQISPWTSTV